MRDKRRVNVPDGCPVDAVKELVVSCGAAAVRGSYWMSLELLARETSVCLAQHPAGQHAIYMTDS
jgi:hypothetical protein